MSKQAGGYSQCRGGNEGHDEFGHSLWLTIYNAFPRYKFITGAFSK